MADDSEQFVGSKLSAENGYGQNGFHGASSDLPGKNTTSGFLPQSKVPADGWQTRSVSKDQYPTAHGMSAPKEPAKIPSHNTRRAHQPRTGTHFQR